MRPGLGLVRPLESTPANPPPPPNFHFFLPRREISHLTWIAALHLAFLWPPRPQEVWPSLPPAPSVVVSAIGHDFRELAEATAVPMGLPWCCGTYKPRAQPLPLDT